MALELFVAGRAGRTESASARCVWRLWLFGNVLEVMLL